MNLEGHLNNDEKHLKRLDEFLTTSSFIKRYFNLANIDEKEIARIAGIFQVVKHWKNLKIIPRIYLK